MLTHYLDLALLPDPEFAVPQLMDALFAKLHRQLVLMQSDSVAVAFPQYLSQGCQAGPGHGCCGCWGLSRC
jgi:CRISPR-associated endonuclease Csy4